MNWPSLNQVYRHHRMLTKQEALFRQIQLSACLSAGLVITAYFLPALLAALLFVLIATFVYASVVTSLLPEDQGTADIPPLNPDFTADQFASQGKSVEVLCDAIRKSNYHIGSIDAPENSLIWLNALLCIPSFYEKIIAVSSLTSLPHDSGKLFEQTEGYRKEPFKHLIDEEQHAIRTLNRMLIEHLYAAEAPGFRKPAKKEPPDQEIYKAQMPLSEMPEEIVGRSLFTKLRSNPHFATGAVYSVSLIGALLTFWVMASLPVGIYYAGLFLLSAGAFMLIITAFLTYVHYREIDEYTEIWSERLMLRFQKLFSYSRGYFFIGTLKGKRIGLPRMLRFLHFLIIGPTGEGKSTTLIIPPLLHDADSVGSAVVPDAKSPELHQWVSGRWLKAGKKVFLFDPWFAETVGINPLLGAEDSELLVMVEVLMHERKEVIGNEDPFFKSRTLYMLFYMLKMVQSFDDKYANLASLYHIVQSVDKFEDFVKHAPPQINELFTDFALMGKETRVNTLSSVRQQLDFLMDPAVRRAFSKSEFTIDMLFAEREPCLLILGYPTDMNEVGGKIDSLIINLIIKNANRQRRCEKELRQSGQKARAINDLYLYLDELRFLKITGLADLVSIARGSKIQVIASATDLDFFKYYKADFTSITANFRTQAYVRGVDPITAKQVSENLGEVNVPSYRIFRGLMLSQESKKLMTPDKVRQLPEDRAIIFSPKTPPFIAKLERIYTSKFLKRMCHPPPKSMRELYRKWGVASSPLTEPGLPTLGDGLYDYAKIQSIKTRNINEILGIATGVDSKTVFKDSGDRSVYVPPPDDSSSDPFGDDEGSADGFTPEEQIVISEP